MERIESILTATKRACGIVESYDAFDSEILEHINAALGVLHQLGVGPLEGFVVEGYDETWDEFVEPGPLQNLVRQYIPMSARHDFDPPTNSGTLKSMENRLSQLESRMSYYVDPKGDDTFFTDEEDVEEKEAPYSDPYWG